MYWKEKANEEFKQGRNETALQYYTKAIELNNTESVFFSNRARCLKKMGRYEDALKDAQ
jgi:tetratricopeptide (TPR) repeat protein